MEKGKTSWCFQKKEQLVAYLGKVSSSRSIKPRFKLWFVITFVIWLLLGILCSWICIFFFNREPIWIYIIGGIFLQAIAIIGLIISFPIGGCSILLLVAIGTYKWLRYGGIYWLIISTIPWIGSNLFFAIPLGRYGRKLMRLMMIFFTEYVEIVKSNLPFFS